MAESSGERSTFFPAIEKKHGEPIDHWVKKVRSLGDAKYAEQLALLQEKFGFSKVHANAVVMSVRGSTTSKRYSTPDEYFSSIDTAAADTAREIFAAITKTNPRLELVIAWNQPILKAPGGYVLGLSASKNHLTINPFSKDVIDEFSDDLRELGVSKHTFKVPIGWKVNAGLLRRIVKARLAETT
ncbi:MAG: hypothetical protein RLZ37_1917 [Actinomycetota bacterium]|jgi:uncharacterized protein YdhG (YjbR/CyaY superfamily)